LLTASTLYRSKEHAVVIHEVGTNRSCIEAEQEVNDSTTVVSLVYGISLVRLFK